MLQVHNLSEKWDNTILSKILANTELAEIPQWLAELEKFAFLPSCIGVSGELNFFWRND